MIKMSLQELASILDIKAPTTNVEIEGLSIDTRTLQPNNLFVAIQGEKFDGHDFVENAYKIGAKAALVSRKIACDIPQLVVSDTKLALGKIAKNWRDRFQLPLIGVTGSNGKTTLKNMIAAILCAACDGDKNKMLATEGNFNNDIGLPLNLARLSAKQKFGVIEMGMNHPGEISYLTKIVEPTVAVINNAAPAHLEGLKSVEGVARAKGEIFLGLAQKGVGILNADDAFLNLWKELLGQRRCITFGLKNKADVTAKILTEQNSGEAQEIEIVTPKGKISAQLHLLGQHNVMNALAATAATLALDLDLETIKKGLENMHPVPGRLQQFAAANGSRIINDTYNANPASVQAAIDVLANLHGPKILVLGDMKELGTDANALHFTIGKKAHAADIDYLFTLGDLAREAAKAFGGNARSFDNKRALIAALEPHLQPGVNILIKGSRSMKMEEVVAGLMPNAQTDAH